VLCLFQQNTASNEKIQEDITEKFCIAGIFHQTKHYMCTFDFSDCCCFYPFMGITISFIKNVEEKLWRYILLAYILNSINMDQNLISTNIMYWGPPALKLRKSHSARVEHYHVQRWIMTTGHWNSEIQCNINTSGTVQYCIETAFTSLSSDTFNRVGHIMTVFSSLMHSPSSISLLCVHTSPSDCCVSQLGLPNIAFSYLLSDILKGILPLSIYKSVQLYHYTDHLFLKCLLPNVLVLYFISFCLFSKT